MKREIFIAAFMTLFSAAFVSCVEEKTQVENFPKTLDKGIPVCLESDSGVLNRKYDWDSFKLPKFLMGACTHFWQNKGIVDSNLNLLADGGFNSLRDEASWGGLEPVKDKLEMPAKVDEYINAALKRGIDPLICLDYSNRNYDNGKYPQTPNAIAGFARYAAFVANHFKGKVRYYQIWNEWDGGCGMRESGDVGNQTPQGYAALLKETSKRIKEADPSALVVLNSICRGDDFYEDSLKCGVFKDCDISSLHTYNYSRELSNGAEAWYKRMVGVGELNRKYNGGKDKPLFITEMGFPNHTMGGNVSTYERTAIEIAKIYLLARTFPWLKGIWWYDFQDDGYDCKYNENNFGIVRCDLTPKPAFYSAKTVSDIVKNADFVKFIKTEIPSLWILHFKLRGDDVLAMWNSSVDGEVRLRLRDFSETAKPLKFFVAGNEPREVNLKRDKSGSFGEAEFTIRSNPVIISGDMSKTGIVGLRVNPSNVEMRKLDSPKFVLFASRAAADKKAIDLSGQIYTGRNWKDFKPSNLSCFISASYSFDSLRIEIDAVDNIHFPLSSDISNGDSLTFAIQSPNSINGVRKMLDFSAALVDGKCQMKWNGAPSDFVKVSISRDGEHTRYVLNISPQAFGLPGFNPGNMFPCGFFLQDRDDAEMDTDHCPIALWGISRVSRDISNFNMIVLE